VTSSLAVFETAIWVKW